MNTIRTRVVATLTLMGMSAAALADAKQAKPPPQEPAGFVAGAVIGGFAAGPIGAVVGAGLGTWLGNRVHRAGEAHQAEAEVAALRSDKSALEEKAAQLEAKTAELDTARGDLEETNRALTARLDQLAHSVETAQAIRDDAAREEAAKLLDGLQGDILFRTGSADIPSEASHQIEALAGVLAKSPALTLRLDGYADPRGTAEQNMQLSEARARAVRDLFLAAGVREQALDVNAYGKSRSTAEDGDGYALERRVRLTLQAAAFAPAAQAPAAPGDRPPPTVAEQKMQAK